MKMKTIKGSICAVALAFASAGFASLCTVVPESYVSKAWTVRMSGDEEMRVTFWRPDVFRIEKGLKVYGTNLTTRTEISASGQYITVTNLSYEVGYADPANDPTRTQIILPEAKEDASRVLFEDSESVYVWKTSDLRLELDKSAGTFRCFLRTGEEVFAETAPVEIKKAVAEGETDSTTLRLASGKGANYFGGGQQNGSWIHTGKAIDIVADCNWAEGGHPNPAPWMMSRVAKGVYYGILRHTFSKGRYDFSGEDVAAMSHSESRFDAFFFVGSSFGQILDRYTELTGRPNFVPVWGLELGDADAWITRDKETREPKQEKDLSYVETTPDVVARNAEKYLAADMPCGWILVNDGYGCKHMQLAWVVDALASLGIKTGLWTEGALDRIKWEVGTAGTRVKKIDVAWSGAAYQHGLNCNKAAYDGLVDNSDARAFVWTCQGWAGTQRYAVCWTGDQYGNFDLIRYHVPTVTGSGMSGQAYATTDIDGIFGGSPETFVRDLEWKCFTPALYVMNGWSNVNKAPWSLSEPYRSIVRSWLKMKLRLTPYMYGLCRQSWETGCPIVRPLAWNYPDDEKCLSEDVNYEMMLGEDFLVAPMFDSMEDSEGWYLRGIYLPDGVWYDYNDGRLVKGGQKIEAYPTMLWTQPVFVRAGAVIPMYPDDKKIKGVLSLDVYPGGEGACTVYEDDGETRAYENGEWTRQSVKVSAPEAGQSGDVKVVIEGVVGKGYAGQVKERSYELLVRTGFRPYAVKVNGREVLALSATGVTADMIYAKADECWYFDELDKGGTVKIKLRKRDSGERVEVAVLAKAGDRRDFIPYGKPSDDLIKKVMAKAAEQTMFVAKMNASDLYQNYGGTYTIDLDGTWKRVIGSVVCSNDTDDNAVVTFRITTDTGATIFERVGQKGRDAEQIIAVNIPEDAKSLTFTLTNAGPAVPSLGVWKNLRLAK